MVALLLPADAGAQDSCLECHSDPDLTIDRNGATVSLRVDPVVFSHGPHDGFACADCHEGLDETAFPHASPMPVIDCVSCHSGMGESHAFHPAVAEVKAGQPAPLAGDCVGCHGSHSLTYVKAEQFAFAPLRQVEGCGACHEEAKAGFKGSAHAVALRQVGTEHAPTCLTCHNDPAMVASNGYLLEHKGAIVELCVRCHRDDPEVAGQSLYGTPFIVAFESSVHGKALLAGNADAPSCADCHGGHAVGREIDPRSSVSRRQVTATCSACHSEAARDFEVSAHGVAFRRGNRDAPVCTDCHGEHNIMAHTDPSAPIAARNMAQEVCGSCHGSVRLAERYGISPNIYNTFADSFHGLAGRSGAVEVVNCASCHGYHKVLNSKDPESLIHPDNLAATCGTCHPGAGQQFARGRVHVALDRSSDEPLLFWIATLYVWGIVLIIGGMAVHNGVDFFHKVRRKAIAHWNGEDVLPAGAIPHKLYVRMTGNERLQHGLLVISFVLLVITGFMLRYPEAWWVQAIRQLSDHAFEWRGLIHRIAAVLMLVAGVWHAVYVTATPAGRTLIKALWPRVQDLSDMWGIFRYNIGWAKDKPMFGRFSYIEKAEYWALLWGSVIMTITGFMLWYDNTTINLLTKLGFDAARSIHFYEAVLASLAIVVWHFYFVIFNPDVYPMNLAWLTGKMSAEEMHSEHPLELERLIHEEQQAQSSAAEADAGPPPAADSSDPVN
jgi:cytochrome b subunit of formate dehydrogenase